MSREQLHDDADRPLEFGERVYRSFPAPLIRHLMNTKGVGQPTAVIESIEGSTGIPAFPPEEFDALMADCDAIADRATKKLLALRRRSAK